jgi:hypothetical protein
MKAVAKIMTGAAGVAALVGMAAPAAAQYPGYYPGYNTNVVGQVLNTILNPYGQAYAQPYAQQVSPQTAVNRCATAVHTNLVQRYSAGYNPYAYNGYAQSSARVLQVTGVEPRSSMTIRVRGIATSGRAAAYNPYPGYAGYAGYGGYGGYNATAGADLTFKCDIDYRGYIRDIDIDRRY